MLKHIVFLRRAPKTITWGGVEKILYDWFKQIDFETCRVTLVVTTGCKKIFQQHLMEKNVPVNIVEFSFDYTEIFRKDFCHMYDFLKKLNPSMIVLSKGSFMDFPLSTILASFLVTSNQVYMHENSGIPSFKKESKIHFGFIPGVGLWFYKQKLDFALRAILSRKIFVVSQGIKDQLMTLWGYPQKKIIVTYHGVDLTQYQLPEQERINLRQKLNIPLSDIIFIMPCRLSKEKCIDRAIEALDQLACHHRNVWLLILGDGNLYAQLRELASQKINNNRILLLGYQNNIPVYLKAADYYVNSSDLEGMSISFLEAMAAGLICIATDCTGQTELIKNSQSGFLVNKNVNGVLEGMQKALLQSKEERKASSDRGILFIKKYFEVHQSVKSALDKMEIPNIKS